MTGLERSYDSVCRSEKGGNDDIDIEKLSMKNPMKNDDSVHLSPGMGTGIRTTSEMLTLYRTMTPGAASIHPSAVVVRDDVTYPEGGLQAWLVVLGSFAGMVGSESPFVYLSPVQFKHSCSMIGVWWGYIVFRRKDKTMDWIC
jgi:hypothetical protein